MIDTGSGFSCLGALSGADNGSAVDRPREKPQSEAGKHSEMLPVHGFDSTRVRPGNVVTQILCLASAELF